MANKSNNNPPPASPGTAAKTGTAKFSKEQLINSDAYAHRKDILSVLLEGGKTYSRDDVDKKLKEFYERGVE